MPTTPTLLSVAQAAVELGLTERAVRHRIKAGTLAAVKLGPGTSQYVITRDEIDRAKVERASLGVRNIDEFLPPDQAGPVS